MNKNLSEKPQPLLGPLVALIAIIFAFSNFNNPAIAYILIVPIIVTVLIANSAHKKRLISISTKYEQLFSQVLNNQQSKIYSNGNLRGEGFYKDRKILFSVSGAPRSGDTASLRIEPRITRKIRDFLMFFPSDITENTCYDRARNEIIFKREHKTLRPVLNATLSIEGIKALLNELTQAAEIIEAGSKKEAVEKERRLGAAISHRQTGLTHENIK